MVVLQYYCKKWTEGLGLEWNNFNAILMCIIKYVDNIIVLYRYKVIGNILFYFHVVYQ